MEVPRHARVGTGVTDVAATCARAAAELQRIMPRLQWPDSEGAECLLDDIYRAVRAANEDEARAILRRTETLSWKLAGFRARPKF